MIACLFRRRSGGRPAVLLDHAGGGAAGGRAATICSERAQARVRTVRRWSSSVSSSLNCGGGDDDDDDGWMDGEKGERDGDGDGVEMEAMCAVMAVGGRVAHLLLFCLLKHLTSHGLRLTKQPFIHRSSSIISHQSLSSLLTTVSLPQATDASNFISYSHQHREASMLYHTTDPQESRVQRPMIRILP